jgi:hypothetical protein
VVAVVNDVMLSTGDGSHETVRDRDAAWNWRYFYD